MGSILMKLKEEEEHVIAYTYFFLTRLHNFQLVCVCLYVYENHIFVHEEQQ